MDIYSILFYSILLSFTTTNHSLAIHVSCPPVVSQNKKNNVRMTQQIAAQWLHVINVSTRNWYNITQHRQRRLDGYQLTTVDNMGGGSR